jgi:SAM-dependent methyltransferase
LGAQLLPAFLRRLVEHPLVIGRDIDDPSSAELRKRVILCKPFLKSIYDEWYHTLAARVPSGPGAVLELGSGAGYCETFIPNLITSDVFASSCARLAADAQHLPFHDGCLRAIIFTNVMHHIPNVRSFFAEAARCLRTGGKILMIEPWVNTWSSFIYRHFHHEYFNSEVKEWAFVSKGPLSSANVAMPWIVFLRDRHEFYSQFPQFCIEEIKPFMPFRYLVSGGIGMRSFSPAFTYSMWEYLERILGKYSESLGMFAVISINRR